MRIFSSSLHVSQAVFSLANKKCLICRYEIRLCLYAYFLLYHETWYIFGTDSVKTNKRLQYLLFIYFRVGHPFFSKERNDLAFFSVLYKRTEQSLCSFPFFIKERNDLCVLFRSL